MSSRQVSQVGDFGNLPLVSIKASNFFKPSILNFFLPVKAADDMREKMHTELLKLSTNCMQLQAHKSSHFVWVDEPEIILGAIQELLQKLNPDRENFLG